MSEAVVLHGPKWKKAAELVGNNIDKSEWVMMISDDDDGDDDDKSEWAMMMMMSDDDGDDDDKSEWAMMMIMMMSNDQHGCDIWE